MVVICPKCKVKLKVADEKVGREGLRVRCPKCNTVLLVKRPAPKAVALDEKKVLVAHQNPSIVEKVNAVLTRSGYQTVVSYDGVDTMIKALKEMPFLLIVDVALPKIYGFEVAKRLRERAETRQVKIILISSIYDKTRYRREPASLYGADEYVDEHQIEKLLLEKIDIVKGVKKKEEKPAAQAAPVPPLPPVTPKSPLRPAPPAVPEAAAPPPKPAAKPEAKDEKVEKAKRLARTIVSDIYIYDPSKCDNAIRTNSFYTVFASDLAEAMKLYKNRIPEEVMAKGDFFKEAIEDFINKKKTQMG